MGFLDRPTEQAKPTTTTIKPKVTTPKVEVEKTPKVPCTYCGQARWKNIEAHEEKCPENPANKQPAINPEEIENIKNEFEIELKRNKNELQLIKDDFTEKLNAVQNNVQIIQDNSHFTKLVEMLSIKMDKETEIQDRIKKLEKTINSKTSISNEIDGKNISMIMNGLTIDRVIEIIMETSDLKKFDKIVKIDGKTTSFFKSMEAIKQEAEITNDKKKYDSARLINRIYRGDRLMYQIAIDCIKKEVLDSLQSN